MKKKLLNLYKTADYATLREWCVTIYNFILDIYPEMVESLKEIEKIVKEELDEKTDIRRMRLLYREMNWLVEEGFLPDSQMDSLNQILQEKFKHSLNDAANSDYDEIKKIVKRGKILNDREFELVKNREEAIYADESQAEYAEILRGLLVAYECPDEKIM